MKSIYNLWGRSFSEPRTYIYAQLSAIALLFSGMLPVQAGDLYFMADALEKTSTGPKQIDLARFERGGQLPGTYRVEIWLNQKYIATEDISFVVINGVGLAPELNRSLFEILGVRIHAFPALAALPNETIITDPGTFIPDAYTRLDFDKQN
nr:FimD/PapC N-terminal domain-containing protein [Type-E symbiont of Plautia stali]